MDRLNAELGLDRLGKPKRQGRKKVPAMVKPGGGLERLDPSTTTMNPLLEEGTPRYPKPAVAPLSARAPVAKRSGRKQRGGGGGGVAALAASNQAGRYVVTTGIDQVASLQPASSAPSGHKRRGQRESPRATPVQPESLNYSHAGNAFLVPRAAGGGGGGGGGHHNGGQMMEMQPALLSVDTQSFLSIWSLAHSPDKRVLQVMMQQLAPTHLHGHLTFAAANANRFVPLCLLSSRTSLCCPHA